MKILKGFTLIELLIVITIIGILAVVFLPSVLGAPEKGRDAARQADLSNVLQAIESARLDGPVELNTAPNSLDTKTQVGVTGCLKDAALELKPFLGGVIPSDPGGDGVGACADDYLLLYAFGGDADFAYALVSKVEQFGVANVDCTALAAWTAPVDGTPATYCYGVRGK